MKKERFCVSGKLFAVAALVFVCMIFTGCPWMDGVPSYYVAEYSTRKNFLVTYELKFSRYDTFEIKMRKDGKTGVVCKGEFTGSPLESGSVELVVKELRPSLEQDMTKIPYAPSAVRHVIIKDDGVLSFDDNEQGFYDWEGRSFYLDYHYEMK